METYHPQQFPGGDVKTTINLRVLQESTFHDQQMYFYATLTDSMGGSLRVCITLIIESHCSILIHLGVQLYDTIS